jgi:hypothetical protein
VRVVSSVAAATALLTACSHATDASRSGAPSSSSRPGVAANGAAAAMTTSGAGVEDRDLRRVLVEQDVTLPGRPRDRLRIGVQSLRVAGKVMVLRVVVTPHFASVSSDTVLSLWDALGHDVFRPRLIHGINLKEYSAIGDGDPWVSSELDVRAVNGSPMLAWAYFAAPQDNILTVDIRISDA